MKKLVVFNVLLFLVLVGCSQDEISVETTANVGQGVNLEYLEEINTALTNSENFETIELERNSSFNQSSQKHITLISKGPNMGYSYPVYEDESMMQYYYGDIYIEEDNFIAWIVSMDDDKELTIMPQEENYFYLNGEVKSDYFKISLLENPEFIQSIEKKDNVYTVVASDKYFEYTLEETIKNIQEITDKAPEDGKESAQASANQFIEYNQNLEEQKLTIEIIVENDMVVSYYALSSMMAPQYTNDFKVTKKKYYSETGSKIEIIRFNDEEIRNEILKVYDMYK